jgi:hypothetical protein
VEAWLARDVEGGARSVVRGGRITDVVNHRLAEISGHLDNRTRSLLRLSSERGANLRK